MLRAQFDPHALVDLEPRAARRLPPREATRGRIRLVGIALLLIGLLSAPAHAQDWGSEDDDWSSGDSLGGTTTAGPPTTPWSFRAGMGFTNDPDTFLLNFELPYRFDQYVSAGPMMQVGLEDNRFIVAPTMNLTVTGANLLSGELARFQPTIFAGIGFAILNNDDRGGDTQDAGFLVNTGFGIDYLLSDRVTIGSRMLFNFLPGGTLDERFFYAWEVASVRLNF